MPAPHSLGAELRHPLNIAGLLTWATVAIELALNRNLPAEPLAIALVALLLLGFVGGMFLCTVADHLQRPRAALGLIAMQAACVLGMTLLVPSFSTLVLSVILMAQLAPRVSTRTLIACGVLMDLAVYLVLTLHWEATGAIITVLLFGGFQAFAVLTSRYAARAEAAQAQTAQINAQLLATRTLLADSASDQERLRLARELHDVAGHKLTALKLNLTALARTTPDVALAAQLADELLRDIRAVVREMRNREGIDIAAAIAQLAAPFPRLAVHASLDANVDSVTQAETIVRAAQEALTNAARHAGAVNVWIVLRRDATGLHLDVRDDGRGSGPIEFGAGLSGMRERFLALGGGLDVGRGEHGGLELHGWMPA
jgi:signal transduction histidine kinase